MGRYRYSYTSIVRYSNTVSHHSFMLRAVPMITSWQHIVERDLQLLSGAVVNEGGDAFGNAMQYGYFGAKHDIFVVSSVGVVECGEYLEVELEPAAIYVVESALTHADEAIISLVQELRGDVQENFLELSMRIAGAIYERMCYVPRVTTMESTAAESYAMRKGVCQDYAHVMLSVCRAMGIYARYVVGFVIGTGETHAWVEVSSEGVWYGIDPTHNARVGSGYIKVAHGRDAHDCSVIRGLYRGDVIQESDVRVTVEQV